VSERDLRDKKNLNTDNRCREAVWTYETIEQKSQMEDDQTKSPKGGRPRKPRVTHTFRRLIIYSSANRVAQQKNRDRHRLKFEKQLQELNEKLQTTWWKTKSKETAEKAVLKIRNGSKMSGFYEIALAPGKEGGWNVGGRLTWQETTPNEKQRQLLALLLTDLNLNKGSPG
jgi:hypothetical protein